MTELANWEGDQLGRRQVADFLYGVIRKKWDRQEQAGSPNALCIAIDGDWGVGKTFFAERWSQQLRDMGHPVVRFDAWKNDLSEDPLVGFVSELRKTLRPWIASLPVATRVKTAISRRAAAVVSQAAKAAPALLISAGGHALARRLGDEALDILREVAPDVSGAQPSHHGPGSSKATERAVEQFFKDSLKRHEGRQAAIDQLVASMTALVEHLKKAANAELPFFVFVDELDRCRPDYAIRLLEGMKHLFNAAGVCFIVTTNLKQLSHAISAVYGAGFNGYGYLKRFFDFEYQLPDPEGPDYSKFLISKSWFSGVPVETAIYVSRSAKIPGKPVSTAICFDYIAKYFSLSLRSQSQVLAKAEAAASALPEGKKIHVFFLFALAAIAHDHPAIIDELYKGKPQRFTQHLESLPDHIFFYSGNDKHGKLYEVDVSLKNLISHYYVWSKKRLETLMGDHAVINGQYPQTIPMLFKDQPLDKDGYTPLRDYAKYVRLAGQMFQQAVDD